MNGIKWGSFTGFQAQIGDLSVFPVTASAAAFNLVRLLGAIVKQHRRGFPVSIVRAVVRVALLGSSAMAGGNGGFGDSSHNYS